MQIYSEFIWERNSRPINEDSLCICHAIFNGKPIIIAAICDGVGGMPHGEHASALVIKNLKESFKELPQNSKITLKKLSHLINRSIYNSHNEIKKGATTLSMILICNKKGISISYGDSRVYIGKNQLSLITKDHKDANGRLTQALGSGSFAKSHKKRFKIHKNTTLLLCSDGFYRYNHRIITQNKPFLQCNNEQDIKNTLLNMYYNAVNNNERDNCSAIAIKFIN